MKYGNELEDWLAVPIGGHHLLPVITDKWDGGAYPCIAGQTQSHMIPSISHYIHIGTLNSSSSLLLLFPSLHQDKHVNFPQTYPSFSQCTDKTQNNGEGKPFVLVSAAKSTKKLFGGFIICGRGSRGLLRIDLFAWKMRMPRGGNVGVDIWETSHCD